MSTIKQLPLKLSLPYYATFANFFPHSNHLLVNYLQNAIAREVNSQNHELIYIWGKENAGKTHLLHACCNLATSINQSVFYLPLQELAHYPADICEDLDKFSLICIDDIETIAGLAEWEENILHLYNRLRERGGGMIMTSKQPPKQTMIQLADLKSRLSWGVIFQLFNLTDQEKLRALQMHAESRGLNLPIEVAELLIHRHSRHMPTLCSLLGYLDEASLAQKRRLTIPFVKKVLSIS